MTCGHASLKKNSKIGFKANFFILFIQCIWVLASFNEISYKSVTNCTIFEIYEKIFFHIELGLEDIDITKIYLIQIFQFCLANIFSWYAYSQFSEKKLKILQRLQFLQKQIILV